jgi:hypothetical protein
MATSSGVTGLSISSRRIAMIGVYASGSRPPTATSPTTRSIQAVSSTSPYDPKRTARIEKKCRHECRHSRPGGPRPDATRALTGAPKKRSMLSRL